MQINDCVRDERLQLPSSLEIPLVHFAIIDWPGAERFEDAVVLSHFGLELFRKQNRLDQIRHAETGARGLVAVGRTDAARTSLRMSDLIQPVLFSKKLQARSAAWRAVKPLWKLFHRGLTARHAAER